MRRCLSLAVLGAGKVAPNPMVGAVLVHDGRVIGEGYHRAFGGPHAEVNCIESVPAADRHLIPRSVLYVSLEPCAHYGKTPPCVELVIKEKIPTVVIGARDPFPEVNGKGIERLNSAGIDVINGVLESECVALNRRFFTYHKQQRPYVILKWAQTADAKIAAAGQERLLITNDVTNRLVHKWRSEEAGILVGKNTAIMDDPSLNVRLWHGANPTRMVIDMNLALPGDLRLFDGSQRTLVFNSLRQETKDNITWYRLNNNEDLVHQVIHACYALKIQSLIVEGGARLLQSFIDAGNWDEARMITNMALHAPQGLPAPMLPAGLTGNQSSITGDVITYYTNKHVHTA
ncbi:MAG: diaminohydroxyphosphoribosylaminopyrimidine deaminase [Chitinophagaceae bacterium]|nr:diaminohydroxyphosphoribosylaminopyrimidine deaminase [Chitinophagaceae bacterium]